MYVKKRSEPGKELKLIFAKNLRRALNERGISQLQLANAIHSPACAITKWLNGSHAPSFDSIARLSKQLDVEPSYFLNKSS